MSLDDFEFGRVLGKGVFGSVLIVKRKQDQQIYAMKRVRISNLSKRELQNSFNEVRLLASLNHKNVIGYREAFYDKNSKTLNIVMEYADDGDLSVKIKKNLKNKYFFEESTIWATLIQILEGLKYLHKSNIIHRDLKSANIFLTKKGIIKIGDLNVSKIIGKNMAITQTGTPYYASPEIWNDSPYDYKCDIWSVGCIIYEMATLRMPFRGTSMQVLYTNVMKGEFAPLPSRYSDDLMNIIKLILVKNPQKRPSAEDLLNNDIILNKIEKYSFSDKFDNYIDESALLMRTIKIPKNLNQMNEINKQFPKNYKKDIINNRKEMLENDDYEVAKNSFYQSKEYGKAKINKKIIANLSCLQVEYNDNKNNKKLHKKAITDNELNIQKLKPKINIKKYKHNLNYNHSLSNIYTTKQKNNIINNVNKKDLFHYYNENKENMNINNKYQNDKEILKKINYYIFNKKDNILTPNQRIIEHKRCSLKHQNKGSLRISTSNIFTSDEDKNKYHKIKTTVNEPIKLLRNPYANNSMKNNIHLYNEEEKNICMPINNLNKGSSFINNNKMIVPLSISSIQQQSRQKKYMDNQSLEIGVKNKNLKTINCDKDKYNNILYDKKIKEKSILRNKSCKRNLNKNIVIDDENIVGDKILKRKKRINRNTVRRNVSTDFISKKNNIKKNHQNNYRNNSHIFDNIRNSVKENISNNQRVKILKKKIIETMPPFEIEKIYRQRLPSANINNKVNKNNINVRININNNYNYINKLNFENNNHKFITENPCFNYENYHSNVRLSRPKSTSSIISDNRAYYRHQNLNDSEKKYIDFYNIYYQKFMEEKIRSNNTRRMKSNQNKILNNGYKSNDTRKVIYEKINIIKNDEEGKKYIKGPSIIRNIRGGNYNNQCHREIFKYQNSLKMKNDYSIHNFVNKESREDKNGPRVIIPKKMIMGKF